VADTTDYAYEAFELLYRNWHLMSVSWPRVRLLPSRVVLGPSYWADGVKYGGIPDWRAQFEWLEARYRYKYDRETVAQRQEALLMLRNTIKPDKEDGTASITELALVEGEEWGVDDMQGSYR
jgi:hypothetical protein